MSTLISIDFAKAFNTMGHQACLESLTLHGASPHMVRIVGSFLMGRTMTFKAGSAVSSPRPLKGGSPQGTLLGNFLFVMATNRLERTPANNPPPLLPTSPQPSGNFQVSSPVTTAAVFDPDLSHSSNDDPDDTFRYLSGQNAPLNRIDDTFEDDLDQTVRLPPGNNFDDRPHKVLKFVDDFLRIEKLCLQSGQLLLSQNKPRRMIRAHGSEGFFNAVETSCTSLGMSVNAKKNTATGNKSLK